MATVEATPSVEAQIWALRAEVHGELSELREDVHERVHALELKVARLTAYVAAAAAGGSAVATSLAQWLTP